MSLRNSRGEAWEIPPKEENLAADIRKVHRLVSRGHWWGCVCGQIFSHAKSRRDGEVQITIHQRAVIEAIEDNRAGRSHYDANE